MVVSVCLLHDMILWLKGSDTIKQALLRRRAFGFRKRMIKQSEPFWYLMLLNVSWDTPWTVWQLGCGNWNVTTGMWQPGYDNWDVTWDVTTGMWQLGWDNWNLATGMWQLIFGNKDVVTICYICWKNTGMWLLLNLPLWANFVNPT